MPQDRFGASLVVGDVVHLVESGTKAKIAEVSPIAQANDITVELLEQLSDLDVGAHLALSGRQVRKGTAPE